MASPAENALRVAKEARPTDAPSSSLKPYRPTWMGDRQGVYDPKFFKKEEDPLEDNGKVVATRDKLTPKPNFRSQYDLADQIKHDPSKMYRGMSHAEYHNFLKTGHIKSNNSYNIGPEQQGLTYWTKDPQSALTYSNGFAPDKHKPAPGRHAYVVAAHRPSDEDIKHVEGVGEHEIGVKRAIGAHEVTHVYRGRVAAYDPGVSTPGVTVAPRADLHWEEIRNNEGRKAKASGGPLDPGHPQREANLAKFQEGNHPLVPSVLYHGTNRDIRAFDLDKPRRVDAGSGEYNTDSGWFGKGIYLTPHKRAASAYAGGVGGVTHDEGANVMPVHASLKNPFIVKGLGGRDMDRHLSAAGMKRHPRGWNLPSEQTKWLKEQGHDGVIAHDPKDPGAGMEYVVFHPHQLKSAIGNSGHFNPNTTDITKKSGGRVARAHGGATRIKLHIGPIHSSVAGRTDHLPMHVPSGSYVIPADVVSGHGEGNTIAGFKIMRRVFGGLPYGGARGIYGQGAGPYGEHLATGGAAEGDEGVPIVAAGGEYVVSPAEVVRAGDGDLTAGHRALDEFVKQSRAAIVKTMSNLPGPKHD